MQVTHPDVIMPPQVMQTQRIAGRTATDFVAPDGSAVDRSLFVDDALYRLEQQRIFGRCWLYLGHESELPRPGSFIAASMGEDPVFVTRDRAGKLHAFLNSCTHRGAKVCRADVGEAATFKCPYHGWIFDNAGRLMSVPRLGPA